MDRSEIRSLLHDVIAVETEPFSVRVATLASAIDRIEAALRAARAEGIEAAWQAAYAAMANETNASQQRVRKAIRALLTKESDDAP